jgi:hypothetical protein
MKVNRKGFALLAGVASVLVVGASAATLGGLTPQTLGTSTEVVASCQTGGLGVSWGTPTYDSSGPTYNVSSGTITGILPACNGKAFSLDVADGSGTSLGSATGTLSGATQGFSLSAVDSQSIENVTLVIYG